MGKPNQIVTTDSVRRAVLDIKANGGRPTLRGIKDFLGGGSLATIHVKYKEIENEIPDIPIDIKSKLNPVMAVSAELIQSTMRDASVAHMDQIEQLGKDCDALSESLSASEAARREAVDEGEALRASLIEREAVIRISGESIAELKGSLDRINAELAMRIIREGDYQAAKAEAAEARDRAAKLEGRLEEMERSIARHEGGPARKEAAPKRANA
jgi:chromosome segregation ATPase